MKRKLSLMIMAMLFYDNLECLVADLNKVNTLLHADGSAVLSLAAERLEPGKCIYVYSVAFCSVDDDGIVDSVYLYALFGSRSIDAAANAALIAVRIVRLTFFPYGCNIVDMSAFARIAVGVSLSCNIACYQVVVAVYIISRESYF